MYVPCDTAAGSPFGIVFVLPEDTTPFNCEGTYHFRGRGRGMIYIRAMAARKTCPPSSSPERRASGLPPPVGRGCRAPTTVMSDVVAVEQSFLSSLASKGLFFVVPAAAVCGCIAVQASADVLVIERATYLFFLHRSRIIRQREGEREWQERKVYFLWRKRLAQGQESPRSPGQLFFFFLLPTISAIESRKIFVSLSL